MARIVTADGSSQPKNVHLSHITEKQLVSGGRPPAGRIARADRGGSVASSLRARSRLAWRWTTSLHRRGGVTKRLRISVERRADPPRTSQGRPQQPTKGVEIRSSQIRRLN
jgi:hypothetical protein